MTGKIVWFSLGLFVTFWMVEAHVAWWVLAISVIADVLRFADLVAAFVKRER